MTFEMSLLIWSVALLLVQIGVQALLLLREQGVSYDAGPRDENRVSSGIAGRAERALRNFLETYPAFVALILAGAVLDQSNGLTQWGASLYMIFRIAYVPLYLAGIPYIRSLAWTASIAGLVMMMAGLFYSA